MTAELPATSTSAHSVEDLGLRAIIRDAALQCRAAIDEATVLRYMEVVENLPPVKVVKIVSDGVSYYYLVDGWHRYEAHARAEKTTIRAEIVPGTRRDAILAAVQANSSHGLPRSHDDARRAVRTLLLDAEWCQLGDRQIARLADVSHTHVAKMRARYGVEKGQALTEERACQVDGELPAAWKALGKVNPWDLETFEAIRLAQSIDELLSRGSGYLSGVQEKAFALRAQELAVEPWPWSDDWSNEQMREWLDQLDTVEDLRRAAGTSIGNAYGILPVYHNARLIEKMERYKLVQLLTTWAGRRALIEQVRARIDAIDQEIAAKPKEPWERARAIHDAGEDPKRQDALVSVAPKEVFEALRPRDLAPEVRNGVYRERIERGGDLAGERKPLNNCADPSCDGWIKESEQTWGRVCVMCGLSADEWRSRARDALGACAELLAYPGYGFVIDGVVIDAAAIGHLKALRDAALKQAGAVVKMPGALGAAVRGLTVQSMPLLLCVDPSKAKSAPDEDDEDDEDEDEEEEAGDDE